MLLPVAIAIATVRVALDHARVERVKSRSEPQRR